MRLGKPSQFADILRPVITQCAKESTLLCIFACAAYAIAAQQPALAREIDPADPIVEFEQRQGFTPSVVDLKRAREILARLSVKSADDSGADASSAQRAHEWAEELFKKENLLTMKAALLLTPHFRNEFVSRNEHLFHVRKPIYQAYTEWFYMAPVIYVLDAAAGFTTSTPMVLDPLAPKKSGAREPLTLDQWTRAIMETQRSNDVSHRQLSEEETSCPIIDNFRDFAIPALQDLGPINSTELGDFKNFQNRHARDPWCMVRILPMYYRDVTDLQILDCDPTRDPNFMAGFFGRRGKTGVGSEALVKVSGHFNYACASSTAKPKTHF